MDWLIILTAGLAGTVLMTIFTNMWTYITGFEYRVPNVLGTLITMTTKPSGRLPDNGFVILTGYIFHFLIGLLFSLCYYLLWVYYLGQPDWVDLFSLGLCSVAIAVLCWYGMLRLHPLAPRVKLKSYLTLIFLGHFIFTAGIISTWKVFTY